MLLGGKMEVQVEFLYGEPNLRRAQPPLLTGPSLDYKRRLGVETHLTYLEIG